MKVRRDLDDAALGAILALEKIWRRAHEGYEWRLDRWGEGPSRVSLADLGLDARVRTLTLLATCPPHGAVPLEWTGRLADEPPTSARCQRLVGDVPCEFDAPVHAVLFDSERRAA